MTIHWTNDNTFASYAPPGQQVQFTYRFVAFWEAFRVFFSLGKSGRKRCRVRTKVSNPNEEIHIVEPPKKDETHSPGHTVWGLQVIDNNQALRKKAIDACISHEKSARNQSFHRWHARIKSTQLFGHQYIAFRTPQTFSIAPISKPFPPPTTHSSPNPNEAVVSIDVVP